MNTPSELISAYLCRTLTPEQGRALCDWVKADMANAQEFAREVFIHRQLRDELVGSANRRLEEASAGTAELPGADDTAFAAQLLLQVMEEDRRAARRRAES